MSTIEAKLLEDPEAAAAGVGKRRRHVSGFLVAAAFAGLACLGLAAVSPFTAAFQGQPASEQVEEPNALQASKSKYTKVQYVGFQIFTTPGTTADGCFASTPDGADASMDECYLGSPAVANDLQARMEIMLTALENAHASSHWDHSPSVLKVFLAPEFYWRGKRGAYRLGMTGGALKNFSRTFGEHFRHEKWTDWLIVPGTVIMAELADSGYADLFEQQEQKISYFNVAPIIVGGPSGRRLLEYKHYISGIDFVKATPHTVRTPPVKPAPGSSSAYCAEHPDSNGCIYGVIPERVLRQIGWRDIEVVRDNVFEHEGLRVGIEVCLDHAMGQLAKNLGSATVDLQLITSAGMNIGFGPVGTRAGGPVFLNDGYAETSMSLNEWGGGRNHVLNPSGSPTYNVGFIYEADPVIGLQQWLQDSFSAMSGTGFGTNMAGRHDLPGGSKVSGVSGIPFKTMSALGPLWRQMLEGYYNTADYDLAAKIYNNLDRTVGRLEEEEDVHHQPWDQLDTAFAYPTLDFYGPFPLVK